MGWFGLRLARSREQLRRYREQACRLRLAQRDPALTQRARLHDVTPCHRHRPPASAGLVLGVLQSANRGR